MKRLFIIVANIESAKESAPELAAVELMQINRFLCDAGVSLYLLLLNESHKKSHCLRQNDFVFQRTQNNKTTFF